jgi:hypothetical protein
MRETCRFAQRYNRVVPLGVPLRVIDELGVRVVEGTRGESLVRRPQDATLVIEACLSRSWRSTVAGALQHAKV